MDNVDKTSPEYAALMPSTKQLIAETEARTATYPESEVTEIPADGDYDHRMTAQSLLGAQVCTRKTAEEAAAWLTTVRPPDTSYNRWEPDTEVAEMTCEQFPDTHRHVIVVC